MWRFLLLLASLGATASAQVSFPDGYDVGENSVRGGEIGESLTLEITPYNAGRKLFENERFTIYERVNYLATDVRTYGDPLCMISKPGDEYQYQSSRVVVVLNIERDEAITRRMLWDEVRPVISDLGLKHCPEAHGIVAHIYVKGWDVAASGQAYMPEAIPLPKVQLEPVTESDLKLGFNHRNTRAYDAIHGVVSDGILTANFAFPRGPSHFCGGPGGNGVGCTFDTFAPVYLGAPEQMLAYSLTSRALSAGMASQREAMRLRRDQVVAEYEGRYTSFDGYVKGVAYRIERDEYVRRRKALRQKQMDAFYKAMSQAMDVIEERGWGPSLFNWVGGGGSGGNRTVCGARANSVMDSCTEDFLFLVY